VHRTARVGLRVTAAQRRRCFGPLASAGDVWACTLDLARWRRQASLPPLAGCQELCRELASAGPGTFGELDSAGARSVLRRYSDAWFTAAKRRKNGDTTARYPRRKRRLMPVRYYHATFTLDGRRLRLPVGRGCPPLWVRLDRDVPYPAGQVRSVTLLNEGRRLLVEVTAEVPVATYPAGQGPRRRRPGPGGPAGLRAGHPRREPPAPGRRQKAREGHRAVGAQARPGRVAAVEEHPRPAAQAGSSAQAAGDPGPARGRRRHRLGRRPPGWHAEDRRPPRRPEPRRGAAAQQRTRDWRIGHLLACLQDKAARAGITAVLVDERGTSSTCPSCTRRVPKPSGRTFSCPCCGFTGHRDLVGGANIATRTPGGGPIQPGNSFPVRITHRRAGNHLPGASPARRDPRRRSHDGGTRGSPGRPRPAPLGSGDVARPPPPAGREDHLTPPGPPGKR
jgi:hypothetical protein